VASAKARRNDGRSKHLDREFYTRHETAGILRVSVYVVDQMIASGELKSKKFGKRLVRIPASAIRTLAK